MTASVTVKHTFEAAHRLPFLGGKCTSLHGHSWAVEVSVFGRPDDDGILLDFASVKAQLREWIDRELDHGTMLGAADPLWTPLLNEGCKVFIFDGDDYCESGAVGRALRWPTVENVAELIRRVTLDLLGLGAEGGVHVRVAETPTNEATAR